MLPKATPTRQTAQAATGAGSRASSMSVSFIIPLYNCLAHTQECLRTLEATVPAEVKYKVIFVDDGSTDGTRDWLAALSGREEDVTVLLNERNLGFAGACNRGAAEASGDLLFFLNNDLVFLPGWFQPMAEVLRMASDVALVGNIQRSVATGEIDHAGVRFNCKAKPEHDTRLPWLSRLRGWREVPAVTGACLGIRAEQWERLGGFDEGFANGGEDIDLCLRARAAGYRNLVALRSVVLHHVSQSKGRKLRDEHNSRRLAERWRTEIALLSARAWAGQHLETSWHGARDPDGYAAAMHMLFLSLGVIRRPALAAVCGADRAIEREMQRWREILDGVAPQPVDTSVRTAQI
jgi:O-antigen biosynthesis protein